MYGLLVAREVVRELRATQQLSDPEFEVVTTRIENLSTLPEEISVSHILEAIFNGLNESARVFAREYDHSHLRPFEHQHRPAP